MLSRALARLTAAAPSRLKYALAGLKPLHARLLRLGGDTATVRLGSGTVRWRLDELTSQQHLLGTYEPYMQRALERWARPGAVVYDIGAHAGFASLYAALLVGPGGKVVAFEPYPTTFRSLERQLAANPGLPITALPIAASDVSATLAMRRPNGSSSQSFISAHGEVQVQARPIDELVAAGAIPPPAVIKLDVEGHEAAALRGALATIAAHRPVILCDYNDDATEALVRGTLAGLGYRVRPGPPVTALPEPPAP
jgi:FkbM family methyltransferase